MITYQTILRIDLNYHKSDINLISLGCGPTGSLLLGIARVALVLHCLLGLHSPSSSVPRRRPSNNANAKSKIGKICEHFPLMLLMLDMELDAVQHEVDLHTTLLHLGVLHFHNHRVRLHYHWSWQPWLVIVWSQ